MSQDNKNKAQGIINEGASGEDHSVNLDGLAVSLIQESGHLVEVLNCSMELLDMFDANAIVDCVTRSFKKSCGGEVRIWRMGAEDPVIMGAESRKLSESDHRRTATFRAVRTAIEQEHDGVAQEVAGREYLTMGGYVMEYLHLPADPNIRYVSTLYFKHMVRAMDALKERLVIAKAFNEIQEILDLKKRVEGSLEDIRDQSTSSIGVITDLMEDIIDAADGITRNKRRAAQINDLACRALNETQVGDLTNQKIFASLHNLDALFTRLRDSLDPTTKSYMDTLYNPVDLGDSDHVVSSSLMDGQPQADQASVDDLLAGLGL